MCALVFVWAFIPAFAQKEYRLSEAITEMASGMSARLPESSMVVVFDIRADSKAAQDILVDDLTYAILQTEKLIVVDRQNIDKIRSELSFQLSGDVSDESAQRLGAMLGAQTLITGTFDLINNRYRFSVKAVKIETSEIQYMATLQVRSDGETEALFGRGSTPRAPAPSASASVGKAVRTVADFTGRAFCMAINPFFGIGSYIQGDSAGGGTVMFWELVGMGAMAYGAYRQDNDEPNGELIFGAGGFALGGAIVYSWVRPWVYNRAPRVAEVTDSVRLALVSHDRFAVSWSYSY